MKKKLLALLCVLSVLIGVFALSATTATAAEEKFYVGYAKVDINPYYDEENGDLRIMPLPLRGLGTPQARLAYEYLIDDNGSGGVDYMAADGTGGDGLFLTCIAISNSKDSFENAVFLFTMDAIGDMGHTAAAREAIVKNLGATYGIAADQIMVSGTHAHSGVDLTQLNVNSFKTDNVADVTVVKADGTSTYQISGATAYGYLQTYWNRLIDKFVAATEAAINDCTVATVKKGQIEVDQSTAASGKTMNFVRHYVAEDGSNGYDYVMDSYSNPDVGGTFAGHVSEVDQTLHTISFNFDNTVKDPIVLINWRNHPQFSSSSNRYVVSSDYINAFRYKMETSGYRPAFFQGTGGNTQPDSRIDSERWVSQYNKVSRGIHYGQVLANVTLECLAEENMTEVAEGKVQTKQNIYTADRIVYSETKYKAAVAALKQTTYPFFYTDTETGEKVTISCDSQATKIVAHYETYQRGTTTIDLEIDTIMIGPEIAIVTCPGEPFDRYSQQAADEIKALWNDNNGVPVTYEEYYAIANKYNDWDNLKKIPNAKFGEPLIFGYANQHITYIPNALAYNYNAEHPELYSTNSYESFMTPLAEGGGEQMVANLATMLNQMVNSREEKCEACGKSVTWYNLNLGLDAGYKHYYLAEDMTITSQLRVSAGTTACLDLNGKILSNTQNDVNARVFDVAANATLNIQDSSATDNSDGTGEVKGTNNGGSGGAISIAADGIVNIYGGKIYATGDNCPYGGVILSYGTVNVYGGVIQASNATRGDAICLYDAKAHLNVYGGEITKKDDCIAFRSSTTETDNAYGAVTIGGNAKIDEITCGVYVSNKLTNVAPTADTIKIVDSPVDNNAQTPFTGSVVLKANDKFENGAYIGSTEVPLGRGASVTISSGYDVEMNKDDNRLVAVTAVGGAAGVVDQNEDITPYGTLAEAIDNVGNGYVILGADVEKLTVSSDITIDLNGRNITGLTVADNATLTLMDSKTADYFIGDQVYGIVENVSGNVVAADNYLEIKESVDGEEIRSYHCYKMNLSDVVLRPGRCGMYYKSEFNGDAMVVEQIESFGTALRIGKAPDANSMKPGSYSAFAPEKFGGESNSTILVDILKKANIVSTNQYNAKLKVYGRAYIKLVDGSYLFTDVDEEQAFSLKTLTEKVSKTYSVDVLKENADLMEMYRRFSAVMSDWDIQNIEDAYAANQTEEMETLKILLVGNSHSLDSFHLLYDVIEAEGIPENNKYGAKSVELGVLYYGGCRMRKHAEHAKRNVAAYDYYRVGPSTNGEWVITPETTMKTGLLAEHWDIVVFQEMNMEEGLFVDTATNIAVSSSQYVYDYIRCTLGYTPEFKWNMIWSNPTIPDCCDTTKYTTDAQYKTKWIYKLQTPAYGGFLDGYYSWENRAMAFYKNDPQEQYNKTVKYLQDRIIGYYGITDEDNVVAPGTTVMYAINELNLSGNTGTAVEQRLADEQFSYRDYTHLSDVSRVMVSYLWYAELFGLDKIDSMAYTIVPAAMRAKDQSADVVLDTNMQTNIIKAVNYTLNNRFGMVK